MTAEELEKVLKQYGHLCHVKKDEVVLDTCVFCGNTSSNLELNAGYGVYHCWACGNGGRLETFLKEFLGLTVRIEVTAGLGGKQQVAQPSGSVSIPGEPASKFPSAVMYLRSRGFGIGDFIGYNFKVDTLTTSMYYGRLIIPVRHFWSQELAGFVARGYAGERPKYLSQVEPGVVGYRVRSPSAPYVLSEGAFDGIAVHRAGCNSALLLGRTSSVDEYEPWVARVPPEAPICILMDGDAQKQSNNLWWRAKAIRPDAVRLQLPAALDPAKLTPSILGVWIQKQIAAQRSNPTLYSSAAPVPSSRITFPES